MEVEIVTDLTVGQLIDYKRNDILKVNGEYQRGLRWTDAQKRMFIDSIFRNYSIPAFYFHKIKRESGSISNTYYDIVDGQQRIDAIYSYSEGAFPLLKPSESGFRFPNFVRNEICPWGGKRYGELSEELKQKLNESKVIAYEISTINENEIRDLFIRLQGGTPLTPQDKRDSWPGNFTEFVLRVGGKTGVEKWYGFDLFKQNLKVSNESRRRQLVAQVFMLFFSVREEKRFCDLKSINIDEFYHHHVDFDEKSKDAERFERICKILNEIFSGKPKIVGHHLIHSFLLVDSLLDEYVSGWESHLASVLHEFERKCKQASDAAKKGSEAGRFDRYWNSYAQWTRTNADLGNTIQRRHAFFVAEMLKSLAPEKIDKKRIFTDFERQTVFFRDKGLCQFCEMHSREHRISWQESEVHHVTPHSAGGVTEIDNGALVHRECHPKSSHDVENFRNWWDRRSTESINMDSNSGFGKLPLKKSRNRDQNGKSRYSGLRDYLVPVVRMIRTDGKDHTEAFKSIAHELNVRPSTVNAMCTRSLNFIGKDATQKFADSVRDGTIVQIAKDRYPDEIDYIDYELASVFPSNNG